eukprot:6035509-Pleurochrysis_carterae.AAC.1
MSRPGSAYAGNVDVDAGDYARYRPLSNAFTTPITLNRSVMARDYCRSENLVIQRRFFPCNMCARRPGTRTCTWAWAVIRAMVLNRVRAFESINYLPSLCIDKLCVLGGLPQDGQPSKPWRAESGFKGNDSEILLMAIQHTKSSLMNGWRTCFCKSTATPRCSAHLPRTSMLSLPEHYSGALHA